MNVPSSSDLQTMRSREGCGDDVDGTMRKAIAIFLGWLVSMGRWEQLSIGEDDAEVDIMVDLSEFCSCAR